MSNQKIDIDSSNEIICKADFITKTPHMSKMWSPGAIG